MGSPGHVSRSNIPSSFPHWFTIFHQLLFSPAIKKNRSALNRRAIKIKTRFRSVAGLFLSFPGRGWIWYLNTCQAVNVYLFWGKVPISSLSLSTLHVKWQPWIEDYRASCWFMARQTHTKCTKIRVKMWLKTDKPHRIGLGGGQGCNIGVKGGLKEVLRAAKGGY